ncbi:hypothetical protein O7634_12625 [Micromonospora sp. WMMD1120]|uniref:hypothetical protein n=1 Tax=Micromonospora sp. WMMD1120 TaxID=3016106 RepID=UPI00241757CA|nr:hypothetical protein [Micromonospora sp. WMMD1120]MDG4807596.1 hypothetical protein [Micromonospora sp. WMMD1120]
MAEHIRFILSMEVAVDDPIEFRAGQLDMARDSTTGEMEPVGAVGLDLEEQVGNVAVLAAMVALRDTPGVSPVGGSTLPWEKAEDGSWPEKTLPRMSSRAELDEWARRRSDEATDEG